MWLSAASVWEISVKFAKGTLRLKGTARSPGARGSQALPDLHAAHRRGVALHVIKLPRLHTDPFDRMLVSQAIIHGLTIVTPDPLVTQYPARTMW